jgi:hypothetical protein
VDFGIQHCMVYTAKNAPPGEGILARLPLNSQLPELIRFKS